MEEKRLKKRARGVETKWWSESEVNKVLDYMLEHKNFEVRACRMWVIFVDKSIETNGPYILQEVVGGQKNWCHLEQSPF